MAETELEKGRDVTRREMAEALEKSNALLKQVSDSNAQLQAELATVKAERGSASTAALQRELADAKAELAKRSAVTLVSNQPVSLVPYSGLVRAKAPCVYEHKHEEGEVFHVELPALWTDDPFEAVIVTGMRDDGVTPITEANPSAPKPIHFAFRRSAIDPLNDPTPRMASSF